MWPFSDEVNDWFGDVKANRSNPNDDREVVPMARNEDPRIAKLKGG